jgi:SAM-dependent methyltransferase
MGNVADNKDWVRWHDQYDDPQSSLSQRLEFVRAHVAGALDDAPPGPVSVVSLCAGQGRDVIGVLPDHPRRADVTAVLVELDPVNAGLARECAAEAGLTNVEVREADAALVPNYADALPADVLLLCGIFGNVPADDIRRTAAAAAGMCRPGGTVIWTRHRREPDLTTQVRAWFADAGFDEVAFEKMSTTTLTGVGVGRRRGLSPPRPALPGDDEPLFTFQPE